MGLHAIGKIPGANQSHAGKIAMRQAAKGNQDMAGKTAHGRLQARLQPAGAKK